MFYIICVWRIYDEENMKIVIQALMVILCLLSLTFVRFTALSTVFKTTLCHKCLSVTN